MINEWYTMYVKNFNFLFKSMFLRKNGRIEKNWNSFAAATPEKQAPPYWSDSLQNFNNFSAPTYYFFKKKLTPSNLKRREAQKVNHSIVPWVFLQILVYIYILCILEWKWRTPTMVVAHARKIFRDYNN